MVCATCGQRFTGGDARFCPYDGERLAAGVAGTEPPAPDPLLGAVIDHRYEVTQVLGEGGMGTVYRVRHRLLGRNFALKALRRELASDPELPTRFIREAKAAAAIAHPNVVQISDFGVLPSGQPYFVMELLAGRSLSALLWQNGPLSPGRAVRIFRQVAEGLGAAHAAGVVHRDLKPDNIHVADAGSREMVKVLDFGLAKVAGASKLTRNGIVYGTPHYMSPEQAAGEPVDHRSDIYSLGVVMYEALTGRVPFEADTYMGILTKHLYVEPTPPSEVLGNPMLLGALEDITLRCMQKKPTQRYGTMAELLAAFDRVVQVTDSGQLRVRPSRAVVGTASPEALRGSQETTQPRARARNWKNPKVIAALGGAALVAAGAAVALALQPAEIAPPAYVDSAPALTTGVSAPELRVNEAKPSALAPAATPSPVPDAGSANAAIEAPSSANTARRPSSAGKPTREPRRAPTRKSPAAGGEIVDPWAK